MSSGRHTPGPWFVNHNSEACPEDKLSVEAGNYFVCTVDHSAVQEANARLIAAAPDLLEALKNLMCAYSEPDDRPCCSGTDCGCMGATRYQQAEHYARSAIAKATGSAK